MTFSARRRYLLSIGGAAAVAALALVWLIPSSSGAGNVPKCFGKSATMVLTNHSDGSFGSPVQGTNHADVIVGLGGGDQIDGRGGNDRICGNDGGDNLIGNIGDDKLNEGKGPGGAHGDSFLGGELKTDGNDVLRGGGGGDDLNGRGGNDKLLGEDDDDSLDGGSGDDNLSGARGDDSLDGGADTDTCDGGNGADGGGPENDVATNCETESNIP